MNSSIFPKFWWFRMFILSSLMNLYRSWRTNFCWIKTSSTNWVLLMCYFQLHWSWRYYYLTHYLINFHQFNWLLLLFCFNYFFNLICDLANEWSDQHALTHQNHHLRFHYSQAILFVAVCSFRSSLQALQLDSSKVRTFTETQSCLLKFNHEGPCQSFLTI